MTDCCFGTPGIRRAFERFTDSVKREGMLSLFEGGVLCALSGGADSVLLVRFMRALSEKYGFFLKALHVNHHLRGAEADRDAALCERLCCELSIPLTVVDVDVLAAVRESGEGIEEAARRLRYGALYADLDSDPRLSVMVTAHNATDNLETVLHQVLRGGGIGALTGIYPVRGRLLRPLLCLGADEIRAALTEAGLSYAEDSTNSDITLTRNYIRREILPLLSGIANASDKAVLRMCESLRHDEECLSSLTDGVMADVSDPIEGMPVERLIALPEAIRRRVIRRLFEAVRSPNAQTVPIEHTHLLAISRLLLEEKPFSYAVPDGLWAHSLDGLLFFSREEQPASDRLEMTVLSEGETVLPGGFLMRLDRDGDTVRVRCSSNLYKIDTTAAISSAIIKGALYVRGRLPGDSYRFSGHTHLLKKLFNEKKIPHVIRPGLPILCDDNGILWMPLCPTRDAPGGQP